MFNKVCAACHQLGGQGAKIGPGLDGVGLRGLDRLLEDTLDPSRNVDQAFRTTLINTTGGNVISGLLLREEGEVLVLADAQGKEIRLPRGEVEERSLSKLSPMPANVADLIPEGDYYNLLGFLLEQKQKVETARQQLGDHKSWANGSRSPSHGPRRQGSTQCRITGRGAEVVIRMVTTERKLTMIPISLTSRSARSTRSFLACKSSPRTAIM